MPILYGFADPEHIKRERRKAQELRQSSWWKQQLGRGICYYCGEKFAARDLTMDHVVPVARGGKSTKKNCVVACKPCNAEKGHRFTVEMTLDQLEADNLDANASLSRAGGELGAESVGAESVGAADSEQGSKQGSEHAGAGQSVDEGSGET